MSQDKIVFGVSKQGTTISFNAKKPVRIALLGNSGCGKSVLLTNIILQYIQKLRSSVIFYAIDPKITSLMHLESRLDYLCTEPALFLSTLDKVETIMAQRFVALRSLGKSAFSPEDLPSYPMIVLILEEAMSIVQNEQISREANKQIMKLYTTLFTRARAANISIIMVSHSFSAECLPTVARDQLNSLIIMQTGNKQNIDMLVSSEEAPANVKLKEPGDFYWVASNGASPIQCKTWYTSNDEAKQIAESYSMDKHENLTAWEVKNPNE